MTESTSTDLAFLGDKSNQIPAFFEEQKEGNLGNENVAAEDQQIPRLSLLQPLSPQIENLEGAKAGLFHNSITDELYENVALINLFYAKEYAIWRKRAKGGGLHGAFDTADAAAAQVDTLPGSSEDYDIVETAKHACLLVDQETGDLKQPIMIYMKSSGLSASRLWNTKISTMNGDQARFATIWSVSCSKQSNDKGTWYNWQINEGGWLPTQEMYDEAKSFYESMKGNI